MKSVVSPAELQVLALVATERTGPEIASLYRQEAQRDLPHGTLYAALRRLRGRGLVADREEPDVDRRIRVFRATREGLAALQRSRAFYGRLSFFGVGADGVESAR